MSSPEKSSNPATKIKPPVEIELGKFGHPFGEGSSGMIEPTGNYRGSVVSDLASLVLTADKLG